MEHSVIFPDHRKVCALGQGTWKMGKSALREADEIDALRAGIELGMSVVDTAEMYGNEEMVGAAIRGLRDRVFLVTKVLPGNASRTGTKAACERSLNRLKTDYVDLFLLHWGGPHPIEDLYVINKRNEFVNFFISSCNAGYGMEVLTDNQVSDLPCKIGVSALGDSVP